MVTCVSLARARLSAEASLPETSRVIWQTNYERKGENYWWDLPSHVCQALERAYEAKSSAGIPWVWCWNPQDEPDLRVSSQYILEPTAMVQRNTETGVCRQLRRLLPAPTNTVGEAPAAPDSGGESDADMTPAPAPGSVGTDTFVLRKGTSSRPMRDVHVRCKICLCVMMGAELTIHEAQAHVRNNFGCHQCTKTFYSSRAVRKHSQDAGHAISTLYRYGTD